MKFFRPFSRGVRDPEALTARSMLMQILFCLVCGLLLILFGNLALRITAYVLAGIMAICGVWNTVSYIRSAPLERITGSKLAIALILLVSGTMLAFNPDYPDKLLPVVWGLALLFGGFLKIQYAFDEKSVHIRKWWIMLIFAAFSLIIGILSLLNPAFMGENRNLIIGILLLVEAALDITVWIMLIHALKKLEGNAPPAGPVQEQLPPPSSEPEPVQEPGPGTVPESEA